MQYMQLCHQNIAHVWRKKAFAALLVSHAVAPPSGTNKPLFQSRFDAPIMSQGMIRMITEQNRDRLDKRSGPSPRTGDSSSRINTMDCELEGNFLKVNHFLAHYF